MKQLDGILHWHWQYKKYLQQEKTWKPSRFVFSSFKKVETLKKQFICIFVLFFSSLSKPGNIFWPVIATRRLSVLWTAENIDFLQQEIQHHMFGSIKTYNLGKSLKIKV